MIKTCAICEKTFISKYPNSKYCSSLCKELAEINKRKAKKEEKRKYIRDYMKKYRMKKRESTSGIPDSFAQIVKPENESQAYQTASLDHRA